MDMVRDEAKDMVRDEAKDMVRYMHRGNNLR